MSSGPFERSFAPGVVITNNQDSDKNKHLDQSELGEREVISHENDSPWQEKNRLNIEDQKQHRDDVIPHGKSIMGIRRRIDAAFVRTHLGLFILTRAQEPAENYRENGENDRHYKEDHYRPVGRNRPTNARRSRCCLQQHQG